MGERRYLTVMFCDLVDFDRHRSAARRGGGCDLVGAYFDTASAAVTEMGGHVAKKLGDGLMALFGYPVAQENDAERAVRAALALHRALAELNRSNTGNPALAARIAIDSGPVAIDAACGNSGQAPSTQLRKHEPWWSRARSWSRREYNGKWSVCSSPTSSAATNSKACPRR